MWCSSCQQDVPGVSSAHDGAICCPRCQDELIAGYGSSPPDSSMDSAPIPSPVVEPTAEMSPDEADLEPTGAKAAGPEPFVWKDWDFEQDLQATDRIAQELGLAPQNTPRRIDVAPPSVQGPSGDRRFRRSSARPGRMVAGSVLISGMLAFGTGAALLGWSYFVQDSGLWQVGLPASLAGQGLLIVGLVLQLFLIVVDGLLDCGSFTPR